MTRSVLTFSVIFVLLGCASNPDKISAAYVSPLKYQTYDCDQLALELDHVSNRTTTLYHQLKKDRTADNWQTAAGILLLWPALLFLEGGDGPQAAEYAQLKGEYSALHDTNVQKKCEIAGRSPQEIIEEIEDAEKLSKGEAELSQGNPVIQ